MERYDIDLWFTSKVFQPGHRLRVSIASALYDAARVGVYGGSVGGQNAAGAVLFHPEFYDGRRPMGAGADQPHHGSPRPPDPRSE